MNIDSFKIKLPGSLPVKQMECILCDIPNNFLLSHFAMCVRLMCLTQILAWLKHTGYLVSYLVIKA